MADPGMVHPPTQWACLEKFSLKLFIFARNILDVHTDGINQYSRLRWITGSVERIVTK